MKMHKPVSYLHYTKYRYHKFLKSIKDIYNVIDLQYPIIVAFGFLPVSREKKSNGRYIYCSLKGWKKYKFCICKYII